MKNLLQDMKIGTRIYLLLSLTLALMSMTTAMGLWHVNALGKEMETLTRFNVPLTKAMNKITFNSMEQKIHFERAVQNGTRMARDATVKKKFEIERRCFLEYCQVIAQEIVNGVELLEQLFEAHRTNREQERIAKIDYELRNISKNHSDYEFAAKRVLNLLSQGRVEQAQTTIEKLEEMRKWDKQESPLEVFLLAVEDLILNSTIQAQKSKQTTIVLMLFFSALILLSGLVFGTYISRGITKPLRFAVDIAERIASGDKDVKVEVTAKDETGQLLQAMKTMSLAIREGEESLIKQVKQAYELAQSNTTLQNEVAERKQAEKELARKQKNLEAIFDAAPVGMLLIDENTVVKRTNDVITKLIGRSSSAIVGYQPGDGLGCIHTSDNSKGCGHGPLCSTCPIRNTVEDVLKSGQAIHGVEVQPTLLAGGEEVRPWLDVSAEPVEIDGSKHVIVAIDDITGRRQAQAELETAQEVLIETAHRAGMAEVAADVLHNVGNVLNSINVSTTVIREKVTNSEVANLEKVASIINEHTDDLGTFLTEDPQGKHIPVYLTEVSKCLQNEQTDIIDKLKVLTENVQHIKEIVSMQQSYANTSGVEAPTSLSKLAEDAIQINSAGLERHGTRLIREFEELGDVEIDKQKVLQILVNLVSNAKYALNDINKEEKLLTIRIYKHGEDRFRIEVADNGAGISEDNLAKIFRHGFTTKKDGHGFGLHSCALASKEMGGSLAVHSEGVGQGATFTLELPFKPIKVIK